MVCNFPQTNLVDGFWYLQGVMGCQGYGLGGFRLYCVKKNRVKAGNQTFLYQIAPIVLTWSLCKKGVSSPLRDLKTARYAALALPEITAHAKREINEACSMRVGS